MKTSNPVPALNTNSAWLHRWTYYLVSGFMFASVVLRFMMGFQNSPLLEPGLRSLAGWFLALLGTILFANRYRWVSGLFIAMEVLLTQYLLLVTQADFIGFLFIIPCMQVRQQFTQGRAIGLLVASTLLTFFTLFQLYDFFYALGAAVVYCGGGLFLITYIGSTRRAREIQEQQQKLLNELKLANNQLLVYAQQLQQLAAGRERQRLARELHDSVTQTIFSMTLATQSALLLLDRDRKQVAAQLDRLGHLTHNALTEMQSLISRLASETLSVNKLEVALRELAAECKRLNDLSLHLEVSGIDCLSAIERENLYRIVQEALNNIAKHAGVGLAEVRLQLDGRPCLEIEDHGIGFDPHQVHSKGRMGLVNMEERAKEIGWDLRVDSSPGNGTRILVGKNVKG